MLIFNAKTICIIKALETILENNKQNSIILCNSLYIQTSQHNLQFNTLYRQTFKIHAYINTTYINI